MLLYPISLYISAPSFAFCIITCAVCVLPHACPAKPSLDPTPPRPPTTLFGRRQIKSMWRSDHATNAAATHGVAASSAPFGTHHDLDGTASTVNNALLSAGNTSPHAERSSRPRQSSHADALSGLGVGHDHRQLSISPSPHSQTRAIEDLDGPATPATPEPANAKAVTWSSLPRKGQLAILTLARLSEPLTQTSLQSYLYYQLASFSPDAPPSTITSQAGVVIAAFAAAQAVTAVFWGGVADAHWGGRKFVIIVGLCGTGLGSLGYGFSGNWRTATAWRVVAGSLNGNVGVMRTMISEIVVEKKCVFHVEEQTPR